VFAEHRRHGLLASPKLPVSPLDQPGDAPRALYIYYRVPACHAEELSGSVLAMQAHLREAFPGLRASLMQRVDEAGRSGQVGDDATWMEVYEHPDGVSPACEQALEQAVSALPKLATGARHVEVFVPLMSPGQGSDSLLR